MTISGRGFVALALSIASGLFVVALITSSELSHRAELDESAASVLAAGPSRPIDTSAYAVSASERRAISLAEGLRGPGRIHLKSVPLESESPTEQRALRLAEGSFGDSPSRTSVRSNSAEGYGEFNVPETPSERKAIDLATASFGAHSTFRERSAANSDRAALRLAEGKISDSERQAIADGESGSSKGQTAAAESASERRALQLAEGKISAKEANSIADGGEGILPVDGELSSPRSARHDDQLHFSLPDDTNIDHDIVFGRKQDRDLAIQKLLRAASRITGQKYVKDQSSKLAKGHQEGTQALSSVKATPLKQARAAAAARRLVASGPWVGGGHRALKGLTVLTRAAQSSLDDIQVRPDEIRRGWDGF